MTGIKTIMAVIGDATTGLSTLETAFLVGRDMACHVRVFHARPDPTAAVPMIGEAMSASLVEEIMKVAEKRGQEDSANVRALFEQFCSRYAIPVTTEPPGPGKMTAAYLEDMGEEDVLVPRRGRLADLIVLGRPQNDEDGMRQATLNAALRESGRAVLVAPQAPITHFGERVAIAWKGTAESARAVSAALPFLMKSKEVVILVAEEDDGLASADDLETHLAWHGVFATVRRITPKSAFSGGSVVGTALLAACSEMDADLLVMGAYTRSRLQRLILGGVTSHVMENATLPVLLSH